MFARYSAMLLLSGSLMLVSSLTPIAAYAQENSTNVRQSIDNLGESLGSLLGETSHDETSRIDRAEPVTQPTKANSENPVQPVLSNPVLSNKADSAQ